MKVRMKLDKIVDTKQEKAENWSYVWIPTNEKYRGHVKFTVMDDKKLVATDEYELPTHVGDIIILDLKTKETQTVLELPKKKKEK